MKYKKNKPIKSFIDMIILCLIIIFGITAEVSAKDSIEITNWSVKCDILNDGSILVNEYINFDFSGNFNGVFREIKTNDTDGIENLNIYEMGKNGEVALKRVDKGKKGQSGIYEIESSKQGENIKIYSPAKNEKKTFKLVYKVKNVCKKYEDIGELYYSFLGKDNETPIKQFNVNINFPYDFNKDDVKIFAHGPLNGLIKFVNNSTVNLNVKDVEDGDLIAARLIFPKGYIKRSTNLVNGLGFDKIMREERGYSEKIENNRVKKENRRIFGKYISIFITIVSFIIFLISNFKYRSEKISKDYLGDILPEECSPAVLSYFYNNTIFSEVILATILDLNRREYLKIDELEKDCKNKKDKDVNYIIKKIKEDSFLLDHENYFMSWIIDNIGDGHSVTTEQIKKYSKKHDAEFIDEHNKWIELIKEEVDKREYFDLKKRKKASTLIKVSLLLGVTTIPLIIISGPYGFIALVICLILLLWSSISLYNRKTSYGQREYYKWSKFKQNIIKGNTKNAFNIYPMDKYFIYAIVLGIDDKRINEFETIIEDNRYSNNDNFLWLYLYSGMFNHKTGENNFTSSIDSAFTSSLPSSGSGGGFTSGGGGAGGGGAGGF